MGDGSTEHHDEQVRTPGPLRDGVELGAFLRRAGDVLVYEGRLGDEAVRLLEYAPVGVTCRDPDGSLIGADGLQGPFLRGAELFQAQTTALSSLDHPNIVEVIQGFIFGGTAWRAERPSGPTLAQDMEAGEVANAQSLQLGPPDGYAAVFDPEAIVRIVASVARGLAAAHAVGVTHLDVSPDTVVSGPEGERLSAFGVDRRPYLLAAADRSALVREGYAPLELDDPTGEERIGPMTDVHGLSALAWRLVIGNVPPAWDARTGPLEVGAAIAAPYPAWFIQAMTDGLAVEPEARLQSVEPFLAATDPTTSDFGPIHAAVAETVRKPRPRTVEIVLAVIACLGAFLLAYGLSTGSLSFDKAAKEQEAEAPATVYDTRTRDMAPGGCFWAPGRRRAISLYCGGTPGSSRPAVEIDSRGLRPGDVERAVADDTAAMRRLAAFRLSEGPGHKADTGVTLLRNAGLKGDAEADLDLADWLVRGASDMRPDPVAARRQYDLILNRKDAASAEIVAQARERVLAIEPAIWNGGWEIDGDCQPFTLTTTDLDFVPFSGPIKTPRDPGRIEVTSKDATFLAVLDEAAEAMTITLMDPAGETFSDTFQRCQP